MGNTIYEEREINELQRSISELKKELSKPIEKFTLDPEYNYQHYAKFKVLNTDKITPPNGTVGNPVDSMTRLNLLARAHFFAFAITGIIVQPTLNGDHEIVWGNPLYINIFDKYSERWLALNCLHWNHFAGSAEYPNWLPLPRCFAKQTNLEIHLRSEYTWQDGTYLQISFLGASRKYTGV